jgi:hypothetical protein
MFGASRRELTLFERCGSANNHGDHVFWRWSVRTERRKWLDYAADADR